MTDHGMVSHNIAQQNKWQTIPSASKTMDTVFWNAEGCILVKFMPHGKISNAAHYLHMIQELQHALSQMSREGKYHPITREHRAPHC